MPTAFRRWTITYSRKKARNRKSCSRSPVSPAVPISSTYSSDRSPLMRNSYPGSLARLRAVAFAVIAAGALHAASLPAQEPPKPPGVETAKQVETPKQKAADTPALVAAPTTAQAGAKPAKVKRTAAEKEERAKEGAMFFTDNEPLVVTLSTDIKR